MLYLISTILFIDGEPIGYNVYQQERDRFYFKPTGIPNPNVMPPSFYVTTAGGWCFEGLTDILVRDQVMDDLEYVILHRQTISA
jgi:hypothetical protein